MGIAVDTIPVYSAVTDREVTNSEENLVIGFIQRAMVSLRTAYSDENGQGLTEYGLILVLIAVVVILMLGVLGGQVSNQYSNVQNSLPH